MAELNILESGGGLGITGRFNYYQPLTDAIVEITPNNDIRYMFKGFGIYAIDPLFNATIEEPFGGFDAELGLRIPYLSEYVETWVFGGG